MTSANIAIDIHQSMLFDDTEFYSAAIKKQIRLLNQSINSEKSLSYISVSYTHLTLPTNREV